MCIICNCPVAGEHFINSFGTSQHHMAAATKHMLACSKEAATIEQRKAYDATHKQMVKLLKKWNAIEHHREHHYQGP